MGTYTLPKFIPNLIQILLRQKRLLAPIRQVFAVLRLVVQREHSDNILPVSVLRRDPRTASIMRECNHMMNNAQSLGFGLRFGGGFVFRFGTADAMEPVADPTLQQN